jgi:hypothetical protein
MPLADLGMIAKRSRSSSSCLGKPWPTGTLPLRRALACCVSLHLHLSRAVVVLAPLRHAKGQGFACLLGRVSGLLAQLATTRRW